jgi:GR25 family glycosyltransferase involved in LPS biosynthesis
MGKLNKHLIKIIEKYKVKVIDIINNKNSVINKKISKIFVINLIHDTEKRNYIITLLSKFNINYSIVIVNYIPDQLFNTIYNSTKLLITKYELGCCVSHLWCLNQIILNNYKNALILEDDIILHKNFVNRLINILESKPKIDFLLLGAHDFFFSECNYQNVKDKLYKPDKKSKKLYGAHANYYSLNGAKRQYYIRCSEIGFFDKEYNLMFNYLDESYICYPNLVVSNVCTSSLNHEKKLGSDVEKDYYQRCFINFNFNKYHFIYIHIFKDIDIKDTDSYKSYIARCLYSHVNDFNKISEIANRLDYDFFKIDDIKAIKNKS